MFALRTILNLGYGLTLDGVSPLESKIAQATTCSMEGGTLAYLSLSEPNFEVDITQVYLLMNGKAFSGNYFIFDQSLFLISF